MEFIKLSIVGILTVTITICLFLIDNRGGTFSKLPRMAKMVIIGCVYGAMAVFGTEFGIPFEGGTLNIRDAAPICASLVFGGPAGIIAAFIGAIERWFAVYWGAGSMTRLAGTAGIIFAGIFSAFVRKFLFEDKRAIAIYAVAVGLVCEVFHLLMVFLTNIGDYVYVLSVVRVSAPYMITLVSLTAGAAVLSTNYLGRVKETEPAAKKRGIARLISLALLITVVIASVLMIGFNVIYQSSIARQHASTILSTTLDDVAEGIEDAEENADDTDEAIVAATRNRRIGDNGLIIITSNNLKPVADSASDKEDEMYRLNAQFLRKYGEYISRMEDGEMLSWKSENGLEFYCMKKRTDHYIILGCYPKVEADLIKWSSVYLTAFSLIIVLAAIFVQIYFQIRYIIIKNIREINGKLAKITEGKLDTVVEAKGSNEFINLSKDLNTMVSSLRKYIDEAETRMDKELGFAKSIQYSALDRSFPESNRYEIYANMKAAREVGGDFYDFYKIDEDRIAVLVADVSGKGIPGSLFMMRSKTVIKNLIDSKADVATIMTKANEELCSNNEAEMFVTAWLGVLDLNTLRLTFANAGHNRPVIIKRDGSAEFLQCRSGFILAGMEDIKYKSEEIQMEKGDSLFLYTDGVTEAVNENNELYSDERLLAVLDEAQDMRPNYMCRYVKNSIDAFAGDAPQFDDITMLALRIKVEEDVDREKVVVPSRESIEEVEAYFERRWSQLELSNFAAMKTNIIIDKVYSNIVENSGAARAKISMTREGDYVVMKFTDNGVESNPLESDISDSSVSPEDRLMGGQGLSMVKKMAESIEYERTGGMNIITVKIDANEEV